MKLRPVLTVLAVAGMAILLFLPADVTAAPLAWLNEGSLETGLKRYDMPSLPCSNDRRSLRAR